MHYDGKITGVLLLLVSLILYIIIQLDTTLIIVSLVLAVSLVKEKPLLLFMILSRKLTVLTLILELVKERSLALLTWSTRAHL